MNFLELVGDSIIITGEILIAYTVITVHGRVRKEHALDKAVYKEMKREHLLAILGIVLLVVGFIIRSIAKHAL